MPVPVAVPGGFWFDAAWIVKEVVAAGVPDEVERVSVDVFVALPVKLRVLGENEAVTPEGRAVVMASVTVLSVGLPPSFTLTV